MAERGRARHPDNTIQRLRHNPRPRLPPRRRLGTCPLTLDASAQLHPSRSHQGYARSHHYIHNFLTRGNGHRILIPDIQLLQWYSQRRDIRRNPLPYSVVKDAVMDLLANCKTTVTRTGATQLLITPALTDAGTPTDTPAPAVIQHAVPPLPRLHKPNHLLDHEQHSYQSHHPQTFEETAEPGPRLSSTSHTTFAQYLQPYAKSWTARTLHLPYLQPTTKANPPTLTSCAPTPLTRCSLPNTTLATQRKSKPQRPSAHPTENSSSSRSRRKSKALSPTPRPSSPLHELQDTRRTSTRNASGRSGQHSNVSARRNPTANQTSTRQEQQPVGTHFAAP